MLTASQCDNHQGFSKSILPFLHFVSLFALVWPKLHTKSHLFSPTNSSSPFARCSMQFFSSYHQFLKVPGSPGQHGALYIYVSQGSMALHEKHPNSPMRPKKMYSTVVSFHVSHTFSFHHLSFPHFYQAEVIRQG